MDPARRPELPQTLMMQVSIPLASVEGTDRLLAARASRPRRRPPGATVAELVGQLSARDHGLARVLLRCSYLCDGIAIRGPSIVLNVGPTVDVSPPFAGR